MKCKSCGINYDDADKECPVCGMGVGKGQHSSLMRYTTYDTGSDLPTYKSTGRSTGATPTPKGVPQKKTAEKSSNKLFAAIVIILIAVFSQPALVRTVLGAIGDAISQGGQSEYDYSTDYKDERILIAPGEVFGEVLGTTLPDGSIMAISFDDAAESYELIWGAQGDLRYQEFGEVICQQWGPNEPFYEEEYTPRDYDAFTLLLEPTYRNDTTGTVIDDGDTLNDTMLLLYRHTETRAVVISDFFVEERPYFMGEEVLDMMPVEAM